MIDSGRNPHIAGGTANGCCLADLAIAPNPSRWSGVIKVNGSAGTTLGQSLPLLEFAANASGNGDDFHGLINRVRNSIWIGKAH